MDLAISFFRTKVTTEIFRFAYVDFATPELQKKALALSETLLDGRKVLIKMGELERRRGLIEEMLILV